MRPPKIVDTFPEFEAFWAGARSLPVELQIDRWERQYLARWPELARKQKEVYAADGVDWRKIARSRIFPHLDERLPRMRRLHRELLRAIPVAAAKVAKLLEPDFPVTYVLHVGIGVGAGWATRFAGEPACLFGLENAAEIATGPGGLPGAPSHELAHLVHEEWRLRASIRGVDGPTGPFWQLYAEGFATECERRVESPRRFRLRTGREDWLPWCTAHRSWLARKFLRDVRARRSVRPFFGSWYSVRGQIECGYFLGAEIIRDWAERLSLREVAVLPEGAVRRRVGATLERLARPARPGR